MPRKARLYITLVIAFGAVFLCDALYRWETGDPGRLAWYLALSVLVSTFKVRLPEIEGTYSLHFLVVLTAIATLSLSETLVIACTGAVVQSLWNTRRRPRTIQVAFNLANLATAAFISYYAFRLVPGAAGPASSLVVPLAFVACVYFAANTGLVTVVLALVEEKPVNTVWNIWLLWSLPYYVIGAAMAGLLVSASRHTDAITVLFAVPIMYLVYRSYKLHVERHTQLPGGPA